MRIAASAQHSTAPPTHSLWPASMLRAASNGAGRTVMTTPDGSAVLTCFRAASLCLGVLHGWKWQGWGVERAGGEGAVGS